MKKNKAIALVIVAMFSVLSSQAQVSNPDTMIHKLFVTLKTGDDKAFIALYPNQEQMVKMVTTILNVVMRGDAMKQMMASDKSGKTMNIDSIINKQVEAISKPETFTEMKRDFGKSFAKTIDAGKSIGIDWSKAQLTTYTFDTTSVAEGKDGAQLNALGYKKMTGVIDFTSNDSAYHMSFGNVVFIPEEGGWFGGEFNQVARKRESLTATDSTEVREETIQSTEVNPPPPPAPPAKTKVKTKSTSSGKTKVKTTSPTQKTKVKS